MLCFRFTHSLTYSIAHSHTLAAAVCYLCCRPAADSPALLVHAPGLDRRDAFGLLGSSLLGSTFSHLYPAMLGLTSAGEHRAHTMLQAVTVSSLCGLEEQLLCQTLIMAGHAIEVCVPGVLTHGVGCLHLLLLLQAHLPCRRWTRALAPQTLPPLLQQQLLPPWLLVLLLPSPGLTPAPQPSHPEVCRGPRQQQQAKGSSRPSATSQASRVPLCQDSCKAARSSAGRHQQQPLQLLLLWQPLQGQQGRPLGAIFAARYRLLRRRPRQLQRQQRLRQVAAGWTLCKVCRVVSPGR